MFHSPPLLLAGIEEIISSLFGLLVLVFWIINQIKGAQQKVARPPAQQPAQRPRPAQARPQQAAAAGQAGQQADPLREQVEAFLRKAAGQQPANPARVPQRPRLKPATDRITVLLDEDILPEHDRRPLAAPFQSMSSVADEPPQVSVAQHVAEHVAASTRALGKQSARLGQRIRTDDEQFDVQLKAKFDHAVGTLAARGTSSSDLQPAAPAPESPAAQIAALLARPEGVRQAIVLNEILQRPADRW
jgi:hypothetical protein